MGGDFAPDAVISGAVLALPKMTDGERLVLFGNRQLIVDKLRQLQVDEKNFDIVDSSEIIGMDDNPAKAFSHKPNSSIVKGFHALKSGEIDGFASAGSTGAMMVGAMMVVKQIPGVIRPAIASCIPISATQTNFILDVGLNPDCRADVLYQYGMLGSLYAQYIWDNQKPRIGLVNIGEEDSKGNLVVKAAYELMKNSTDFIFSGNVEGNSFFSKDKADVLVCDGFVGNVVLKIVEAFYHLMKDNFGGSDLVERFNAERYGGTPVLGVNKPVIIAHGASSPVAIMNMILQTRDVIKSDLCNRIKQIFN